MHIRLWAIPPGAGLGAFQFPAAANLFDTLHPPADGVLAKTLGHQFQGALSTGFSAQLSGWSPSAARCAHRCVSWQTRPWWGRIRLSREKNSPLCAANPVGSESLGEIKEPCGKNWRGKVAFQHDISCCLITPLCGCFWQSQQLRKHRSFRTSSAWYGCKIRTALQFCDPYTLKTLQSLW